MSSDKSSRETIRWLDVAVAARRGPVAASIYPVDIRLDEPLFGITIDQCWIVGGDGRLSVFDTPQAARRFLELLGIAKVAWKGSGKPPKLPDESSFRRFYLSRYKLMEDAGSRQPPDKRSALRMNDLHEREGPARTYARNPAQAPSSSLSTN